MEFTVPQFIERKPKIVGPLTFRQFIYIGAGVALVIFLYFFVSFGWFLLLTIIIMTTAAAFAFLKVEGISLETVLWNFLKFSFSSKLFLWERKMLPSKRLVIKKEKVPKEKTEESVLKIAEKSLLKGLAAKIMTKLK